MIEAAACPALRFAEQFLAMLPAVTVNVVDAESLGRVAAGAYPAVVIEDSPPAILLVLALLLRCRLAVGFVVCARPGASTFPAVMSEAIRRAGPGVEAV